MKITYDNLVEVLCKEFPEFQIFALEKESYEDLADLLESSYLVVSSFEHYLENACLHGQTHVLEHAADFIEKLLFHEDKKVKEIGIIGFLEDLQLGVKLPGLDNDYFYPYLLPESKKWWSQLDRFWTGQIKFVGETYSEEP